MNLHLHTPCKEGDLEKVRFLVENGTLGSPYEVVTAINNGAIGWAAGYGKLDIVKYLISMGADFRAGDNWALAWASENGHLEVVKYLVQKGADVRAANNRAVAWAVMYDHLETVKYLVSVGADINMAIASANHYSEIETMKYLLSQGGDFRILSNKHKTYFRLYRTFKRWRMVVFRRFFRKIVIPLYYSPGFPGGDKAKRDLAAIV